jgi:hypothetical protein
MHARGQRIKSCATLSWMDDLTRNAARLPVRDYPTWVGCWPACISAIRR